DRWDQSARDTMAADDTVPRGRKPVNRSPRHPAFDLKMAVDRARELYEQVWDHSVPVQTAKSIWGFSSTSSSGIRCIAALIHFGLLQQAGSSDDRSVRLTDRARDILIDEADNNREREAAL